MGYHQITDANINRVAEGLRVIEEYVRFIRKDKRLTKQLAALRQEICQSETNRHAHLMIRDSEQDMRAKEAPRKRVDLEALLTANFKRVEEGLRVLEEYTGNPLYNRCRFDAYMLEKDVILSLSKPVIRPGVYLISDSPDVLKRGVEHGVSLIQLRDKSGSKADYYDKAKDMVAFAKSIDTPFFVNDYLDIALLVDADGFHSGQDDISVAEQRRLLGPQKLIGRTTHTLEQGLAAEAQGADYVSVGPLWETPSKPGREGIGFAYLKAAQSKLTIPYVAIGGISMENIDEVLAENPPLIGFIRAQTQLPEMIAKVRDRVVPEPSV